MESSILTPVLLLVAWTLVIWAWMYALRIPAMSSAGIDSDDAKHPGSLDVLPSHVRSVADNYNHLHEQPTIFYALVFYTHLAGTTTDFNLSMAWCYVALRIFHSLVQCTVNKVMIRFSVFSLSTLALIGLTISNLLQLG